MKRLFSAAAAAAVVSLALAMPAAAQGMGQGGMGQGGMGMGMGKGGGMIMQSCQADIKANCADKKHVQGEVFTCLQKNKDKLSDACKKALDAHPNMPQGMPQGMPKAPAK